MCGIFAILGAESPILKTVERATEASSKLSHRGPDWTGMNSFTTTVNGRIFSCAIAHERLQIIDPQGGEQPILDREGLRVLSINGEIYNYKEILARTELAQYLDSVLSKSDCEVIIPLWKHYISKYGSLFLDDVGVTVNNDLDGDFAYVLWDAEHNVYMIARDPIGVNPLYIGFNEKDGSIIISSEIKAFTPEYVSDFREFPPGHFIIHTLDHQSLMDSSDLDTWLSKHLRCYYTPTWRYKKLEFLKDDRLQIQATIRHLLTESVRKRLMSEVPIGFLLSGGLDSSLICSIAARLMPMGTKLKTFSIGQKGAPDLVAARKVADYLHTDHQEFLFTTQQGISALSNVIYSLETFDVTTCRASTPMFLIARRIKALGIKVLLGGEGSDEAFAGYLYFHKAPNPIELYEETVDKVLGLSKYDCLRANKSVAAWGVEIRVPFLDKNLLDYVMSIDPSYKMINKSLGHEGKRGGPMEKWLLRQAFEGYLPNEILYRQKEQFSDGVGYGWIDGLKSMCEEKISQADLDTAHLRFPDKTPKTKEAYYYRSIFSQRLLHPRSYIVVPWSRSVACSTERALKWEKTWLTMDEPSGRAVNTHDQTVYPK